MKSDLQLTGQFDHVKFEDWSAGAWLAKVAPRGKPQSGALWPVAQVQFFLGGGGGDFLGDPLPPPPPFVKSMSGKGTTVTVLVRRGGGELGDELFTLYSSHAPDGVPGLLLPSSPKQGQRWRAKRAAIFWQYWFNSSDIFRGAGPLASFM